MDFQKILTNTIYDIDRLFYIGNFNARRIYLSFSGLIHQNVYRTQVIFSLYVFNNIL